MKKLHLFLLTLVMVNKLYAQQSTAITEDQPITSNGLEIGYEIKSQETKKIADQGDFNRVTIRFFVTNTNNEPRIIMFGDQANINDATDLLAEFNCNNATGAESTVKKASVLAEPCLLNVMLKEKDSVKHQVITEIKKAQVGYWIKPGQTINTTEVFIIPLKEDPKIEVSYKNKINEFSGTRGAQLGILSAIYQTITVNLDDFLLFKNIYSRTYLNSGSTGIVSEKIKHGAPSAQWQIQPVDGANLCHIISKQNSAFLNADNDNLTLNRDSNIKTCIWQLESTPDNNVLKIKNLQTGKYLSFENNKLVLSTKNSTKNSSFLLEQL